MNARGLTSSALRGWLALISVFTGCASPSTPPIIQAPELAKRGHPPALYIVVQRDKRLPEGFTATLRKISQEVLPDFRVVIDDNEVRDAEFRQADWIMTVRSSRLIPHYTYRPFRNNALNGINDCVWGSAIVGLALAPCLFQGDTDQVEATIRDARSRTLKTYSLEEGEGGFTLFQPIPVLYGLDEKARWKQLIHALYAKIAADRVFESTRDPMGRLGACRALSAKPLKNN